MRRHEQAVRFLSILVQNNCGWVEQNVIVADLALTSSGLALEVDAE